MESTTVVVDPAELEKIDRAAEEVSIATRNADAVEVRNDEEATAATELLAQLARQKRATEEDRKFIVKPLNDHVKAINVRFKELLAPLEAADMVLRDKLRAFHDKREQARRVEQARLDAEHRDRERHAREVREREEAKARHKREEAEREAREAEQRTIDSPAKTAAQQQQLEEEAERKAVELDAAKADEEQLDVEEEAEILPAPVVPESPALRSESGSVSTRKVWKFEVVGPDAVPRVYLKVDEQKIREAVRNGARNIPGVRIYQEAELAVRPGS